MKKQNLHNSCGVCGKPLSTLISMQKGIGPICEVERNQSLIGQQNLFSPRSEYFYKVVDGVIVIEDLNGEKSVTNDMKNILRDIFKSDPNLTDHPIIYKDSLGVYDGVIYSNINVSFYSIHKTNLDQAIKKAKNKFQ